MLLVLETGCITQQDPVPKIILKHIEVIEEEGAIREYFMLNVGDLEPGWLLAQGYGGDSLLVRYTERVDTLIYSPDYLHDPDTLQVVTNELYAFKIQARWDMVGYGADTTWVKEYIIDWSDSTYSWYSLIITDGYAYPEEFIEDLKLQVL